MGNKKKWYGYLFFMPFLTFFFVFKIFPMGYSFFIALYNWSGFGPMRYRGISQFIKVVKNPSFLNALGNTFYILVVGTPILILSAFVGAAVLNSPRIKFRDFFRGVYFFPYLILLVVVAAIFSLLMDTHYGLINYMLNKVGIESIPWLSSIKWSKISVILAILWRWIGYWMIIFLAGLQNIDSTLYEAGRIDGAGGIRLFWHITIPLMKPILFFVVVMNTIGTLQAFNTPYILTRGRSTAVIDSAETLVMLIYKVGFQYFKLGMASAIAWVAFIIIFGISLLEYRYGGKQK